MHRFFFTGTDARHGRGARSVPGADPDGRAGPVFAWCARVTVGMLLFLAVPVPLLRAQDGQGMETPTTTGRVARVDTPIFRIPRLDESPTIDGTMRNREWLGASALSGFWYDFSQANFKYLAPNETQVEVYGGYDDRFLYIAYSSPVYPHGSWLKAHGRFSDVTHHPRYGLIWDDHVELELRPYHDNQKGYQLGLFKWFVNPAGVVADAYWSQREGMKQTYRSGSRVRSGVSAERWTLEMKIPLRNLAHGGFAGQNKDGTPYVRVPPPPGTAYRVWFTRGIGGNGAFYNVFDQHWWNTTKTKMILDPDTVSFQINELGSLMRDRISLRMTVKNHDDRSRTLRLGFFVRSASGTIYSSYESSELSNGKLELVPGEVRTVHLRKPFPGITEKGNALWFDVRQAGSPAESVFRTRLIEFHARDADMIPQDGEDFQSRRLDVIAKKLRPSRRKFRFTYDYSRFRNRVSGVVDVGVRGAPDKIRQASHAKLSVLNASKGGRVVTTQRQPITGSFATFLLDLPDLNPDHSYSLSVLLFDRNKRVVAEKKKGSFSPGEYLAHVRQNDLAGDDRTDVDPVRSWTTNEIGLDDVVWEPFTEMDVREDGFETLKHRFELASSGLPEQIFIKADPRERPLEVRDGGREPSPEGRQRRGRGPQLRAPMRLVVVADGTKHTATVREQAELVKRWKSELVYRSKLAAGPLKVTLKTRYDADGSMHCTLTYGPGGTAWIDRFYLVSDFAGPFDTVTSGIQGAGMDGADVPNSTLPHSPGVVWDSAEVSSPPLFYSQFVPFLFFGTGDRGFSWYATSDRNWHLNRTGSSMRLIRNEAGEVTWRVAFVNHRTELKEKRTLTFHVLTHPAKPKPEGYRRLSWLYRGDTWAAGGTDEPLEVSEAYLRDQWRAAAGAPERVSYGDVETWQPASPPPWRRYFQNSSVGVVPGKEDRFRPLGRTFEQRLVYYLERQIRVGRRTGWWWTDYGPGFGRSDNVAAGEAYFLDPERVPDDKPPWQSGYTIDHMRRAQKRLARVFAKNNVPQRQYHRANHAATLYESFAWDTQLVEGTGSDHRSYDIDVITQYPASLWRYLAHHFTGLISRLVPGRSPARPGDAKRFDRQWLGRALLNDIGVCFDGPHGLLQHVEQGTRLLRVLEDFGYFRPTNTEFLPYWRNQHIVRLGSGRRPDAHLLPPEKQRPDDHLYVTAYRRPLQEDGKSGYKVLFVLMNEYPEPIRTNLHVLKPGRLFGDSARNELRAGAVTSALSVPEALQDDVKKWAADRKDIPALKDMERGGVITGTIGTNRETYGPLWIPAHDYRLVYAYSVIGETVETKSE